MPSLLHLRPLLLGLALSLTGLPLQAQEDGPPIVKPERMELPQDPPAAVFPTIGVPIIPQAQFQNANLGEVVEYLAQKTGANLMIAPEVKTLAVPDMNLRNVTGIGLLRAIADMGALFEVTETPPETPGEMPVWVIVPTKSAPEAQTNVTRIFNLRGVQYPFGQATPVKPESIGNLVKDIADAINVALQAREEATKGAVRYPVLKVHETTSLMVISGNQQEVDIAQQVVCALGGVPVN